MALWNMHTTCQGIWVLLSYGRRKKANAGSFLHLVLDHPPSLTFQNLVWVEHMGFHFCYLCVNLLILVWLKECKVEVGWVSAALTGCSTTCSDVAQSKTSWKERWKEGPFTGESKSIKKTGNNYSCSLGRLEWEVTEPQQEILDR